jgi:Holliday junction resolvase RusA-like endonuclease
MSATIPGDVVGKGRPRFVRATGRAVTPKRTREWEEMAAAVLCVAYHEARPGAAPLQCPVVVHVAAVKRRRKTDRHKARILRTVKPDIDNVCKCVLDALERGGVILRDQIVCGLIAFSWFAAVDEGPCVEVIVEEVV